MRIGQGIDVHAFGPGAHVVLAGVNIEHDRGVVAHSDGDVVIHALCDAILGALALGDIGHHFPPTDPRWKDVSSRHFLLHCAALITEHGYALANAGDVSVKATTSEKLGFTGRGEGIAAFAVVLLWKPREPRPVSPDNPELDTLVRRLELDPL